MSKQIRTWLIQKGTPDAICDDWREAESWQTEAREDLPWIQVIALDDVKPLIEALEQNTHTDECGYERPEVIEALEPFKALMGKK